MEDNNRKKKMNAIFFFVNFVFHSLDCQCKTDQNHFVNSQFHCFRENQNKQESLQFDCEWRLYEDFNLGGPLRQRHVVHKI